MKPPNITLLEHLRRLTGAPAADAVLLDRWIHQRDEAAFTALVARHGPMVLGVCQRILGDAHEAEDAFQATFLILARKAASLRRPEALSCWLHGVAARLAHKARAAARRRAGRSRALAAEPADSQPDPLELLTVREMLGLIDREIQVLREVYRLPLVLCDLEGRTQEEAAGLLGWTLGSLRGRLLRGRAQLKARLERRGLTLPAGIVLPLIPAALSASLPAVGPVVAPQLAATVTQAAVRFSADSAAAQLSGPAVDLARAGLQIMMLSKVKIAAAAVLTMTVFVAGAGLLGRQVWQANRAEEQREDKTPPAAKAVPKPAAERPQVRLDRFGDPLPEGAVARLGTVRLRHGGEVRSVAFAPDGKTLASGGQDNTVRIWEIASGKEIRRFTAVTGLGADHAWVSSIAFSPDGKHLAAGTMNGPGEVAMWELATGKESRPLRMNRAGVDSLVFSPDGKALAACTQDGLIHLWDAGTGKLLRQFKGHQSLIECIAFAVDGKMLASASRDKTIRLWDAATGRKLCQLEGHTDMVLAVAFAPDGKTLASGSWDNNIRLWDSATGKELHVLKGHQGAVSTLAFLPDGKTLASGSWDNTIRLWDTADGKELRRMQGHMGPVPGIAVSSDGKMLASGSWDRTVRIWDAATGKERRPTEGNRSGLWTVAITPDGQRVAAGGQEGVVRLWDASSGKEILRLIEPNVIPSLSGGGTLRMIVGDHLQFAADGKTVSVPSGTQLGRWDAATGKQIQRKRYQPAQGLYFTPDGQFVIGRDWEANFLLMEAATGKKIRQFKASQRNFISTVSADGKFLACGAPEENGTVVIWELATGKERCRCKGAHHIAYALAFSPDGKYLAGSTANIRSYTPETPIYLWDTVTGREIRQFQARGHYVHCLAYSYDGRMLASGGGDKTVRLWETATGKERRRFEGHQGNVTSIAFSSDGTRLVSASDDTTALVWDATASTFAGKPTTKQLQAAWSDLASDDAAKAYRAVWLLARHPKQSVLLLREQVPPARALDAETRKQVDHWLTDLDSDRAAVRERASAELEKLALSAEPILRKALTGRPSLEQRKRIEQVLERVEREKVMLGRALEVLEHAHAPESRQLLETLAAGEPNA
ncbi:MAG TPA: sigma-70 family RNA polymerase sigma factor [Gemmataceae bacterium]|nr:sigma-70 family RNA polymerase sigma factor [Gemmataceae bacterium]